MNAYNKTVEEERSCSSRQDFIAIWQDMAAIREFETILNEIKIKRTLQGNQLRPPRPGSPLDRAGSIGGRNGIPADSARTTSTARTGSHGEILAKGFSAIRQLDDSATAEHHALYLDGAILRPLEKVTSGTVQELAVKFLVFGAYSEIFARETGFNRGLGGSMHAFFTPFGIYPEQRHCGRVRLDRAGSRAVQAGQSQARHHCAQYRGCILRLRPGLGRDHLRQHGPVPNALGQGAWRRPADHFQLHEQSVRNGRAAVLAKRWAAIHRQDRCGS